MDVVIDLAFKFSEPVDAALVILVANLPQLALASITKKGYKVFLVLRH